MKNNQIKILQTENQNLTKENQLLKQKLALINHIIDQKNNQSNWEEQEQQAIKYVEQIIIPQSEEVGIKGFWQGAILNYLQQQALNFVGTTLKQLAIKHLIDLANWLLENLQDYLLDQYQKASEKEKEIFKQKILEKFPTSKLAQQL